MEVADSNHSKHKKKKKNQTVEGKFRHDLDICSKNKDLTGAISLYDSAVSQNIRLNQYHFNAFLYICSNSVSDSSEVVENSSKNSAFEFGFRIWDQMLSNGVKPTEATMTAVARLASAKGDGDRAFELVKSMGKYGASPRLRSYDPALVCYCKNLEAEKAYNVEEHMVSAGVNPEELELAALLKVSVETGNEKKVYQYFHKLRANLRLVSESTAEIIEDWFGGAVAAETGVSNWDKSRVKEAILRNGGGWHGMGWLGTGKWVVRRSNVDSAGHCLSCEQHLDCVDIDRAETEKFSQSVASLAMEREVQSNFRNFQDWLEKHPEYEAIVDGANIGLYQQNFADGGFCISQLDAAVKELHNRSNKWPLVILHSKRIRTLLENASNRELLQEWMDQGLLYGTPYGSNDDWYWLYAAVKLKCLLVTNDEMRDHIFELLARNFFLKWKERHQVRYNFAKGNLKLHMPPSYSVVIQESKEGAWHVPIAGEHSDESSRTWLCITRAGPADASNEGGPVSKGTSEIAQLSDNNMVLNPSDSKNNNLHDIQDSFETLNSKTGSVMGKRKERDS